MCHSWLLITFSWFGTASLQYINTGGPAADSVLDNRDSQLQYPLPYTNYFDNPQRTDFDMFRNDNSDIDPLNYYSREQNDILQRKRRTIENNEVVRGKRYLPLSEKTKYIITEDKNPFLSYSNIIDDNATEINLLDPAEKKNFSPWGGKRDNNAEHMWTWKRESHLKEPSMPKRVRFSPWGGKRSQMLYKPSAKGTKVIFSTTMPELTRIVSNIASKGNSLNLAGFQFIPSMDKRHPIKVLALSSTLDSYDKALREVLPFNAFLNALPKMYKPGHTFSDINLKKDGKRKVKFSAWGGKRSPPIIGPIWTPSPQDMKESTLNTILLIRNQDSDETTKA